MATAPYPPERHKRFRKRASDFFTMTGVNGEILRVKRAPPPEAHEPVILSGAQFRRATLRYLQRRRAREARDDARGAFGARLMHLSFLERFQRACGPPKPGDPCDGRRRLESGAGTQ